MTASSDRAPADPEHEALAASIPREWVEAAESWYSMHGHGLVRNLLAGAIPLIQAAGRDRADAAEARLAEAHNAVARFLDIYGNSTSASHQAAISLAWQIRKILAGKGLAARERIAAGERERLLGELARRKVTVAGPATVTGPPEYTDMVPWQVLEDVLRGLPTAGCEEVRGG